MSSLSGPRARVAAAALLISTGVGIGLSSLTGVDAAATPVTIEQDAGILRIRLSDAGPTITFTPPSGPMVSQPVTLSGCSFSTSGPLLSVSGNPSKFGLGLIKNGLGVRSKNNCATDNGQFSSTESVTLALGSAFGTYVHVTDAELDVEGKFNADLEVSFDGETPSSVPLDNSSDNGPDSGVGDNDRVVLDDDFRSIRLRATVGAVSLEGGGDGTFAQYRDSRLVGPIGASIGSADTIFRLVKEYEEALGCDDFITESLVGGAAESATVTRGENLGGGPCEDVGATLEITGSGVLLDKATTGVETGAPQAVNAEVEITWAPRAAQMPLPPREIDFDGGPGGDFEFEDVQWCLGSDANGDVIHPTDTRFPPTDVLPWCLVEDDVEMLADGTLSQYQRYHGSGDPLYR